MNQPVTRKQFATSLVIVALGTAGATYQLSQDQINNTNKQAHEACISSQKGRVQGNARALVIKEFLEAAREARLASGTPADIKAANKYHKLDKKVETLPLIDC